MLETITWTGDAVRLLDQTKLPEAHYVEIRDERAMHDAIRRLVVRGAPAIGVAAAFGAYLGLHHSDATGAAAERRLGEVCDYLATSRPTAVNLFWALDRIRAVGRSEGGDLRERILRECLEMLEEDALVCRAIGEHGLRLLMENRPKGSETARPITILTHCNAGSLATVRFGTALSPVYVGIERGVKFHVYADETRPLLQGSRITASELTAAGVPCTILCDNMAATVLRDKAIDAVIVGADRIAANGDTANKIGTLGVAILSRHFGVPFYVAAPTSTIDAACPNGAGIPIEQRDPAEITRMGDRVLAPQGAGVFNPAFDVTPAELIAAIITERGVLRPPFAPAIRTTMAH
jgi:methylthioribose-1-phosphate isomerase